jgi:acyl-CoA thioesterase FadM
MRIEIDALRDDSLLCEGFIEYVFVTPSDLTPVEIPERLLGLLPDVSTGA